MSNVDKAMQMLRWWYERSGLELKGVSFAQAVDILVNKAEPNRLNLEFFGASYDVVGSYKASDAMATLGELNMGKIPNATYFHQVLVDAVDPSRLTNFVPLVAGAVSDSAVEITRAVSNYGVFGIKTLYYIALAGAAVYAFSFARRKA